MEIASSAYIHMHITIITKELMFFFWERRHGKQELEEGVEEVI